MTYGVTMEAIFVDAESPGDALQKVVKQLVKSCADNPKLDDYLFTIEGPDGTDEVVSIADYFCRATTCMNTLDDGEGEDGFCGDCADARVCHPCDGMGVLEAGGDCAACEGTGRIDKEGE